MQIQNVNSTNFQGFGIQTSKMSNKQLQLCDKFIDAISYSNSYMKADDAGIDIFIFAGKKKDAIKVQFMDSKWSDMFFKKPFSREKAGILLQSDDDIFQASSKAEKIIDDIFAGKIPFPKYGYKKIDEGKTDLAKLRPDIYESYKEDCKETIYSSISDAKAHDIKMCNIVEF